MTVLETIQRTSPFNVFDMKSFLPLDKMERGVAAWAQEYQSNVPYQHIGLDDFFDDSLIQELVCSFPEMSSSIWKRASFDPQYEEGKVSLDRLEDFAPTIRAFIEGLNSACFLRFLERLTGIGGLVPDPYLVGGGLHVTPRGGRLGVHVDFNIHQKLGLYRRVNLLLYLNREWNSEWGGELELWDSAVKGKVRGYLPIANRIVIFSTTNKSFHGHPDPLNCPKGVYRRSIALYYYSKDQPEDEQSGPHSTVFKGRPEASVESSLARNVARQLTPPILWDLGRRLRS
jgi:hypothetical protein